MGARAFCSEYNGELVRVDSEDKQMAMVNYLGKQIALNYNHQKILLLKQLKTFGTKSY